MLDRTTRWPEAIPIPDTTAVTVLQAFIAGWIARYGVPRVVTSDRGAQFTFRIWSSTLSGLGITATTTTAYHPQSNGLVERFHRSFKNVLRCAAATGSSWTRNLPWVLLGLRNAPRSETATSAAEVTSGVPLRMCFQQDVRPLDAATRQLQLARENISKYLPPRLDRSKFRHSPFVAKNLRKCDYVYMRNDSLAKAPLNPRYSGPYRVIEKNWENDTFVIQLGDRQHTVSLGRLKAATSA